MVSGLAVQGYGFVSYSITFCFSSITANCLRFSFNAARFRPTSSRNLKKWLYEGSYPILKTLRGFDQR